MGGSACKLVPSIKLDTHHGFPQWGILFGWQCWIVPMYHPALGLHESRWMTQLLEDWDLLNQRLGASAPFKSEYAANYKVLDHPHDGIITALGRYWPVALDTEDHGSKPWSLQFSPQPRLAYLVAAENRPVLDALRPRLESAELIVHNAPHDLDVLARMGIHPKRYRDTMQEAYHLGNLPQGLKPLVYRLFGYTMTSWEDVVRPASIEALLCWMVEALEIARLDLSLIEVKKLKTKVRETVKKGPLERLLSRLIIHAAANEYDPWQRLSEFWRDEANWHAVSHVEARIGPYPILGIGNAPLKKAIQYACGDADWTGQVALELERRRLDACWQISAVDRDQ